MDDDVDVDVDVGEVAGVVVDTVFVGDEVVGASDDDDAAVAVAVAVVVDVS